MVGETTKETARLLGDRQQTHSLRLGRPWGSSMFGSQSGCTRVAVSRAIRAWIPQKTYLPTTKPNSCRCRHRSATAVGLMRRPAAGRAPVEGDAVSVVATLGYA